MPRLRKARALSPGDAIGIAAPAGPVERDALEEGCAWLRELGFEPRCGSGLLARRGYLAGDDARRAAEWMGFVEDPEVAGILCARGGYGAHRILPRLDPARIRAAAKPVMGYSDATTLLLWQRRLAGVMGFHGPMLERGAALSAGSREALARAFRGEGLPALVGQGWVPGRAEGRLVGGSLSLLAASLGTPWAPAVRGAILMLEDLGEQPFRIDRMLQQLRHAGRLDGLVGVGLGDFEECASPRYPEVSVEDVLREVFLGLGVPVVAGLPFGHCDHHLPWPMAGRARIDGEAGRVELLESAVAAP